MNYRIFYEKSTGMSLPDNYEIHHIDLNRDNNDINNLVALPKHLHQEYHRLAMSRSVQIDELIKTKSIDQTAVIEEHYLNDALEFVKIKKKCHRFICFRNKLLGDNLSMQMCKHQTYNAVEYEIKGY